MSFYCLGRSLGLMQCIKVVILGYFSLDGGRKPEHFSEGESCTNFLEGDDNVLAEYLVRHFTTIGNTVLDLYNRNGK